MSNVFDNLIIHLCKFSTLMHGDGSWSISSHYMSYKHIVETHATQGDGQTEISEKMHPHQTPEAMAVAFAENPKAQMATKAMFHLIHTHGDNLREVSLLAFMNDWNLT